MTGDWAISCEITEPSLLQTMACRLFGAKPLSEPTPILSLLYVERSRATPSSILKKKWRLVYKTLFKIIDIQRNFKNKNKIQLCNQYCGCWCPYVSSSVGTMMTSFGSRMQDRHFFRSKCKHPPVKWSVTTMKCKWYHAWNCIHNV